MKQKRIAILALVALASIASVHGETMQAVSASDIKIYPSKFADGAWVTNLSNNGRYAVFSAYTPENTLYDYYAKLLDVETGEVTDLMEGYQRLSSCGANDVSDTGVVVGTFGTGMPVANPAYWTPEKGWKVLPYPEGYWEGGIVSAITPDGRYAVGKVYRGEFMIEEPMLWDLSGEEPVRVETPNVPRRGSAGEDHQMVRFHDISPDGRFLIGCVSFSYTWDTLYFVYDRKTQDTVRFGYTAIDGVEVQNPEGLRLNLSGPFSADGRLIAGTARKDGGVVPVVLDIYGGTVTVYDGETYDEAFMSAVTNEGVTFISSPPDIPIRTWSVRAGRYWVSLEEILRETFGTTLERLTGYSDISSGTIMGMSGDGRVVASLIYNQTGESYVAVFPESIEKYAESICLLDEYTVTPVGGSKVSSVTTAQVRFTRPVEVLAGKSAVKLEDSEGNVVASSLKFAVNTVTDMAVDISFRKRALEDGKDYYLVIPEGSVCLKGDPAMTNPEVRVHYTGREAAPVAVTGILPSPDVPLALLSMSQSPVVISFDTQVTVSASASGSLVRVEDGVEENLCDLAMASLGDRVVAYPLVDQNLYDGCLYRVKIAPGSVCDVQGDNGCEEIVVEYVGAFVPEFVSDFSNNFDDGTWIDAFMFYEGDHNEPSVEMKNWNFLDGDSYPWWWVRDSEESSDYALCSHSMYSPAGKSDDWLILPHLYISDDDYPTVLTFKSQSYRKSKQDRLKVVVWATDYLTSYPTEAFMKRFKEEGVTLYDEVQSPGAKEELLAGDWRENVIPMSPFKGQGVYIAFVNDNEAQSAVFIDDVAIRHDVDFSLTIDTEKSVVNADDVMVKGRVRINDPSTVYKVFDFELLDSDGRVIATQTLSDVELRLGDVESFVFDDRLPLAKGKTTSFTVRASGGGKTVSASSQVNNLCFKPEKRVVIEEYTGQGCGFCPLGIIVLEKLAETYGDKVIPIAIHTYSGDPLASGLQGYTSYLGLGAAAPSAAVDRDGGIYLPMESVGGRYTYMGGDTPLIWDAVATQMQQGAIADIEHGPNGVIYDMGMNTIEIPVEVTFALDYDNVSYNLLTVITEDGLKGSQANNIAGSTDPLAGEWGAGGIYGRPMVAGYVYNDVARALCGITYNGSAGLLPTKGLGGETYDALMQMNIPDYVMDLSKCQAVTMLLDGVTGRVLNACRTPLKEGIAGGIVAIESDRQRPGGVYDLAGRRVGESLEGLAPGLYITSGRKVLLKNH